MREWLYRRLLSLYPAGYLRDYREPMEQAFRDQLRFAKSAAERFRITVIAFADLASTAVQMHQRERKSPMQSLKLHVLALFTIMTLFLGRYELRTDDTGMVALFVALFAFVLAYLQPAWAGFWALVGLIVPLVHIVTGNWPAGVKSLGSLALVGLFVLALGSAGSFAGSRVRRLVR